MELKQPSLASKSVEDLMTVFTREEQELIRLMCGTNQQQNIPARISINTPEREYKLEAIVAKLCPKKVVVESKVRKEFDKFVQETGGPKTPEEEAEWEAKFKAERDEVTKKNEEENAKVQSNIELVEKRKKSKKKEVKEVAEETSDVNVVDA